MRFSIVVPCYQSAGYIGECIRSIKAQKGNWECIVRVETSTDGSREAVLAEIGDDERFMLLDGDPSGSPSASRNVGVLCSDGDYVLFVDSDDRLAPDALERLEPFLAGHPDVATIAITRDGNVTDPWSMIEGTVSGPEAIVRQAAVCAFPLAMSQQFVCRIGFLRERGLRFATGLRHEDEEFLPLVVYHAETFVATHLPLYEYCLREGSIMTATKARNVAALVKVLKSHLGMFRAEWEKAQGNGGRTWCGVPFDQVARAWTRTWMTMFCFGVFHPEYSRATPSSAIRAALKDLFAGGSGTFRLLFRYATPSRRLCGNVIGFAGVTGLIWPARLFFRLYYSLCERRRT